MELSYLTKGGQAKRLKKYSQEGKLGVDMMDAVLTGERQVSAQVTLRNERLKRYFPKGYTQKQMEEVIFSLLETWKMEHG